MAGLAVWVFEGGFGKIGVRFDEAVDIRAFDRPIVDGGGAFHLELAVGRLGLEADGLSGGGRREEQGRRAGDNHSDA